eukprot:CAMPEP_0119498232 /NCGR_PEP_ID=MMETSP1344-20130328/21035_1 /TAXON_ID=236787 /ORGANISM="Florenciella parvula, Strain CCMP2471" /LENGTH=53 /DNA_ID=CAMNT_0007534093 /DNA_START=473 /DNA_END=631 /DNA_ORIENTATION=+
MANATGAHSPSRARAYNPPAAGLVVHLPLFASFGVRVPPSTFPGIAPLAAGPP